MRLSLLILPAFLLLLSACSPEVENEPADESAPPPLESREAFQRSCVPCYQEIAMEAFRAMGVISRLWEERRPATAPSACSGGSS